MAARSKKSATKRAAKKKASPKKATKTKKSSNGNVSSPLGFEAKLWEMADKQRAHMDAAEYKHVVLGLIFLEYISDAFEEAHNRLLAEHDKGAGSEDADSFHRDLQKDPKADYVIANAPHNMSDWGGDRLRDDACWKYGAPPVGSANFAWVKQFVHPWAGSEILVTRVMYVWEAV